MQRERRLYNWDTDTMVLYIRQWMMYLMAQNLINELPVWNYENNSYTLWSKAKQLEWWLILLILFFYNFSRIPGLVECIWTVEYPTVNTNSNSCICICHCLLDCLGKIGISTNDYIAQFVKLWRTNKVLIPYMVVMNKK